MLREFIQAWRCSKCEALCKAIDEFSAMIGDAEWAFTHAWASFAGETLPEENRQAIVDRDIGINKHERAIRRLLVEHLSINPGRDVPGCLALMSIAKDAERIGDYSKNIFALPTMLKGPGCELKYMKRLAAVEENVVKNFPKLHKAYQDSDNTLATQILGTYAPIKEACSKILADLFSDDLPTRESVTTALVAAYLRRINSHMGNIASGIIYPLDRIDFVQDDRNE